MINYLQDADDFDVVSPAGGTVAGNFYLIGAALFGAAVNTSNAGDMVPLRRKGAFTGVPKAAGAAWTVGAILYWDNTAFNFTTTATNNTRVGIAASVQASGDTTGDVILDGRVG